MMYTLSSLPSNSSCHNHHKKTTGTRQRFTSKNQHDSQSHLLSPRICLKNTFFQYKGRYNEQTEGAAMGSPISLIVANLFMEDFEAQAIMTSPSPPVLWKRFVDDTFTILYKQDKEGFLDHLNNIYPNIKFTSEEVRPDGAISFLDILITPKDDGSLQTSVYRKPIHTDLYLQWDSHHTIPSKYSVVETLYHRAKTICSNQEMLLKEEQHLFQALKKCKYPTWALNRAKLRCQNPSNNQKNKNKNEQNNKFRKNLYMVVPYYKGLSKIIKRSCNKFGVEVHFKGGITIKGLLMAPKDKDHILKKVESFINTLVIRWSVMRSTLGNQQGYLLKGSRNIKRLPPPYIIIPSDQAMKLTLTTSA